MGDRTTADVDVAVVGAGFAGLYQLHKLRGMGLSVRVFDTADDVGGTWYWNRYPGARCDIETIDYSFSFDPELEAEWQWSERYATQPEILAYLHHVADRFDLRRDITFGTRITEARWDDDAARWRVRTDGGEEIVARYYVMATGCLSVPKDVDIDGVEAFGGATYTTGRWPHDGVDFTGKRVAVIGTGSSGIQTIPQVAAQAAELTVFQRTPAFTIPARNGPVPEHRLADYRADPAAYRRRARTEAVGGVPIPPAAVGALEVGEDERLARYEEVWQSGSLPLLLDAFNDILVNEAANETFAEFLRDKIRGIVDDPDTAEKLCPTGYPFGTKRPCLDTDYYQTFNLDHVSLVDVRSEPIVAITATGIETTDRAVELDAIVFATGFDALTGALVAVDIEGRDGRTLKEKWADGPTTYLGVMTAGFPNFFMITGPGSPSVLSNMVVSIEQHVEFIAGIVDHMAANDLERVEPTVGAEAGWVRHVNEFGDLTLFPKAASWYTGANVPGKARVFLPYVGGVHRYGVACNEVIERDYLGFTFDGPGGARGHDGEIRRLKPDVMIMLEILEQQGFPDLSQLPVGEVRALFEHLNTQRPPGPDVGEIVDATMDLAGGGLDYRLYRPATAGPHPVVVYFHGGGWVFGGPESDDPLCRELCVETDAVVVSVGYRHAPEHRWPTAVDDGFAATRWVADHLDELGGDPGRLAVVGWSAGGNVAAVVAQRCREEGRPDLSGQVLLCPVTDCDLTRPSYVDNGDGYVLTADVMAWFWDHYCDPADRIDPSASPLRGELAGLPPAMVVTAEFDPLRDEGDAYAAALAEAGVPVDHVRADGHVHTSIPAVDMLPSGAPIRARMVAALRHHLAVTEPVSS